MRGNSATIVLHHSMVRLPEKPMMPRLFDERVGYFTTNMLDYSKEEHRAPRVRYIARWRLEKKDPAAAVSDPVKPIVYYIDAATPMKWREWLKKGIDVVAGYSASCEIAARTTDRRIWVVVFQPISTPPIRCPVASHSSSFY
jgi:hypothetical protein